MNHRFTAIPSRTQLAESVFLCFLVLTLVLGVISLATAGFSPLGAIFDLYPKMPWRVRGVLGIMHIGALIGFGITWLASHRLRMRYRLLSVIVLALELSIASLPG